jgi:hypothetical protein
MIERPSRSLGACLIAALLISRQSIIDRQRKIRFVQVGDGRYAETEREIETLLGER